MTRKSYFVKVGTARNSSWYSAGQIICGDKKWFLQTKLWKILPFQRISTSKHTMVTITVNACLLVFLFQCYPPVYLTMNDCFHAYVLEFQTIFPCVFKIIWMCFAVARVCKSVDQWAFSACKDVPQRKPRATGEFRNLECVSDLLSFPRDIPSPKTRTWARHILSTSKVEDVKFEALAMQQREALIISLVSGKVKLAKVRLIYSIWLTVSAAIAVDNKNKWSMCDVTTCTGDKRD